MEWLLEVILVVLLAATLFHALRLERALGVLKRDRAALEELASGFNSSTRAAEQGIERLRGAADGAGRQLARQIDTAQSLKDDLQFLAERGDRLADRLEQLVRSGRLLVQEAPRQSLPDPIAAPPSAPPPAEKRMRSQAERDLLKALRMAR
jgi:chromosome segregation ATPase